MNLQPLPFTSKFQSGLIYLTITDLDFFKSVIEDLEYKHFDASENHAKLYKLILKLAKTTGRTLTLQIIKNALTQLNKSNALSDGDFIGMTTILDSGSTLIPAEMEYIKLNVIEFLKKQSVALAYSKSLEYFERGDYDTMFDIMSKAHKKSFGIGNNLGLNYTQQALNDRYSQPPRLDVWSTGYPTLDKYLDGGFARKEAISLLSPTGRGKCLGKDTQIIMSDGTLKYVQDVKVGDKLMGPDGKSRNVTSITSGKDKLYKIIPVKGNPYIVNSVHLLSLKSTTLKNDLILSNGTRIKKDRNKNKELFIEAQTLFKSNKTVKHCLKGWRPEAVSFENEDINHPIPPYILGVWLGDGTSSCPNITQLNNEVVAEFNTYAQSIGCKIKEHPDKLSKASNWSLIKDANNRNEFLINLKKLDLINNKHIPNEYKITSIENRLELLAGLLDTDGYLKSDNGYEITQKNKSIAEDIVFIARSLGLSAYMFESKKSIKSINFTGLYYRIHIYGDCNKIPVRIKYKKAENRKQKKNHLLTGITIEEAGYGDYYGFEIDGDKQFLLGDWQVTHNTSLLSNLAVSSILNGKKTIFYTLELSELQIAQRVDAILSSFSIKELSNLGQARIEIQKRIKEIKENSLVIKEFDRGKLSITGLKNHLDKYCMDFGKPDVVIVDWIGCMKLNMSGDRKKHEAIAEIADDIVNLSREYVVTMLTSQQTNRTAVGNNLFGYDSISESFSSLFGMDIVLGLGASDKAKDAGRRTLQILKSRVGPDSVYVNLIGDKPDQPLTFKFREAPPEEEQIDLLKEST